MALSLCVYVCVVVCGGKCETTFAVLFMGVIGVVNAKSYVVHIVQGIEVQELLGACATFKRFALRQVLLVCTYIHACCLAVETCIKWQCV